MGNCNLSNTKYKDFLFFFFSEILDFQHISLSYRRLKVIFRLSVQLEIMRESQTGLFLPPLVKQEILWRVTSRWAQASAWKDLRAPSESSVFSLEWLVEWVVQ